MNLTWRPTEDERRAILYLEALGLIHDLGKLSDEFLKSQDKTYQLQYCISLLANPCLVLPDCTTKKDGDTVNTVKDWQKKAGITPAPFVDRPDLTDILRNIEITSWDAQTYNLAQMALLANRPKNAGRDWTPAMGKDMAPALVVALLHGVAHFEKEDPPNNKQPYHQMFRATPFGCEERIAVETEDGLTAALQTLPLDRLGEIITDQRQQWLADMRRWLAKGLADTRRPQNDVSLWDWGYTVASLTKAMAAWLFRNKPQTLDFTQREWLAWRPLRINLDILGLYQKSTTIPDLLGIRRELDKAFDKVQTLLEETYALANCFYRDETGVYYLFPDFDLDEELRQEIKECFPLDLQPQIHLEGRVTGAELDARGDQYREAAARLVARPRQEALKMREAPIRYDQNLYPWEKEWNSDRPRNAEICPVCGLRPVGYPCEGSEAERNLDLELWATTKKAQERNVCRVCLSRRRRRSQEWAEKGMQGTIWTSEVADNNGRLALVVGRLGLEGWLDGSLFSTIMIRSDLPKAPSPARLYRVAETGRRFWEQVQQEIAPQVVGPRSQRLALYPDPKILTLLKDNLGPYHAYELNWNGRSLEVVWDAPQNPYHCRFVTIENLDYFASRHRLPETWPDELTNAPCQLKEPGAAGKKSREIAKVTIIQVQRLDGYLPTIPLLAEPTLGLLLVPADKALTLALAIRDAYLEQMARVRDRLPLYLGLVFFPRRTPIRAVLEAGRAMLKMGDKDIKEEWWGITQAATTDGIRRLTFDNGVVWEVPLVAGDGNTPDDWYTYFRFCPSIQNTQLQIIPNHISKLRPRDRQTPPERGPKVCISPSRFDFEFLDTSGRRFEISYDAQGRRRSRPIRPFLLDEMDRLQEIWRQMQDLTVTQRYQVVQVIEATREAWFGPSPSHASQQDGTFRQFVQDTLAGAAWRRTPWRKISPELRQMLVDAGVTGELAALAELHLQILKEK